MHSFYSGDRTSSGPKGLEAEHRPHFAFHCPMILLNDIVEILALPDRDGRLVDLIVVVNRRRVAAALVNRNLLWEPLVPNRFT